MKQTMNKSADVKETFSAEDILQKMRDGVKEVYEIHMRQMTIPVRVLSVDEVNAIRKDSIRNSALSQGDDTDKNVHIQKTTLKLASTITKGGGPILGDKLLGFLTVDEINYLYEEYIKVLDTVNPSLETIPPEEFRRLVDALKKNLVSSKELSIRQLRAICTAYADLIQRQENRSSQQDN